MNKSPLPTILLLILAIIGLWSVYLCWTYTTRAKQARQLQATTNGLLVWQQQWQQRLSLLSSESAEYAKQHPAMEQLLRSISSGSHTSSPAATSAKGTTR